jgi:hypothetical protein
MLGAGVFSVRALSVTHRVLTITYVTVPRRP